MRVIFTIAIVAVVASALPSEDIEDQADNLVLIEAQETVSELQRKGTTHADCEELAKTTCKTVEAEIRSSQTQMRQLDNGKKCINLGQNQVMKMTAEFHRTMKKHKEAVVKVTVAHNAQVQFGTHTFNTLRVGSCSQFFGSRTYLTAKATYETAVRVEVSWKGRVREALRAKLTAEAEARRQKKRCLCTTKKTRDTFWKVVTCPKRQARLKKAHAKCKMMQCVLNGTPINDRRCHSTLQKVAKKTLISEAESVVSCGTLPTLRIIPAPKRRL